MSSQHQNQPARYCDGVTVLYTPALIEVETWRVCEYEFPFKGLARSAFHAKVSRGVLRGCGFTTAGDRS